MIQSLLATVTGVGIAHNTVTLYANTKKLVSKTYPTHEKAFKAFLNIAREVKEAR